MQQLKNVIQSIQCDPNIFGMVRRQVSGILIHLGMSPDHADKWLLERIKNQKIGDLAKWEKELHDELGSFGVYKNLDDLLKEDDKEWFVRIQPYLLKTETLNFGGGGAEVSTFIQNFGCNVTTADVLNENKPGFPFVEVNNSKINVSDKKFDQVVLLDVFHHTDDARVLIQEVLRVTKKRLIFVESVAENLAGYSYAVWVDWFYSHVIHYRFDENKKITLSGTFLASAEWERLIWRLTGLVPVASVNLGIYQYLNPQNHYLFVYDR